MNALRSFYRNFPTVKFEKGEIIIHQDETPKYIYGIRKGIVEVYNLTSDGSTRNISFEIADDIIPVCWAFSKSTQALFYYRAHTDCELYMIKKQSFLQRLAESHSFAGAVLDRQMAAYVGTQLQVDALEKPRGYVRLLYVFRYFCLRYGRNTDDEFVKIQIPLTQQDIANFTGLTRETVSIGINRLREEGIISSENKYYAVDTKRLNDKIDDDFNSGIFVSMLR